MQRDKDLNLVLTATLLLFGWWLLYQPFCFSHEVLEERGVGLVRLESQDEAMGDQTDSANHGILLERQDLIV